MSALGFSHDVRMSFCTSCGAPVSASPSGGAVTCPYCNQSAIVAPRDESRDLAAAKHQPTMSEAQRFERLRQQDGKPLLAPPSLAHLFQGGGIPAAHVGPAHAEWKRAYDELRAGGGFPAEERLYHLTLGLNSAFRQAQDHQRARAIVETALDVLQEARHRQMFHSMLARQAAREGELQAAEDWLATCTPYSDDLQTDTAWRFGRAFISTVKGDFQNVLTVLGARPADVPIDDSHDAVAAVFRANALERSGQHDVAVAQLLGLTGTHGVDTVEQILLANRPMELCPSSWPQAQERARTMTQNVIATKTGFRFGCLFVPLFFGGFGLAGGLALVNQAVDAKLAGILSGTLVVGYIVMVFAVLAITMGKTAAITKRLRQNGLRGHGQVMLLQSTGVRVNRQPQLELTLQVSVPGREPFIVRHREVVSAVRIPQVQPGNNLPILVDPNDPAMLVIDWQ